MSHSATIHEHLARIAVSAALLACSLFGGSLHDLHHALDDATRVTQSNCRDQHEKCCGHHHGKHADSGGESHSRHTSHSPKSDSTDDSHDSHACAICYVMGLASMRTERIAVVAATCPAEWRFSEYSESAAHDWKHSGEARGPPTAC